MPRGLRRWAAPRLLVMMMRALWNQAVRPRASVSRPSPQTCRSRSNTAGWAFSISSSRSTQKGCWRTRRVSRPSPCSVPRMSRSAAQASMNSLMSKRNRRSGEPKRKVASSRASSVLPTPVGPTKRNVASGLPWGCRPAFTMHSVSTTRRTASSWPMSWRRKYASTSPGEQRAVLAQEELGDARLQAEERVDALAGEHGHLAVIRCAPAGGPRASPRRAAAALPGSARLGR